MAYLPNTHHALHPLLEAHLTKLPYHGANAAPQCIPWAPFFEAQTQFGDALCKPSTALPAGAGIKLHAI